MPFSIYGSGLLSIRFISFNYVYVAMLAASIQFACSVDTDASMMVYLLSNIELNLVVTNTSKINIPQGLAELNFNFFNGETEIAFLKKLKIIKTYIAVGCCPSKIFS